MFKHLTKTIVIFFIFNICLMFVFTLQIQSVLQIIQKLMNYELQFNSLQWPPNMDAAKLHLRCSRPGKDDINGAECPCCHRTQKMTNTKWAWRNIIKDFKSYGGGIPAYFSMSLYFLICLIILSLIIVIFYIYILQKVCNLTKCPKFLVIFKFCHSEQIYQTLYNNNHQTLAMVYMILLKVSFVFLVAATIGLKVWLQYLNENKIVSDQKVYSRFALMIKNIPGFYSLDDLKKQLLKIDQKLQICQLFYVHEMDQFEKQYRKMFDKHFQLKYQQDQYQKGLNTQLTKIQIQQNYRKFKETYEKVSQLKKNMTRTDGRAIVVFNTTDQRNKVYKNLKVSFCSKFNFYVMKLLGFNTKPIEFYADKISDPYEINWRYVGQDSVHKTKVQIQTSFIGFGFMVFCFALLYFPIIKIDQQKVKDPGLGSILGFVISIILQILSIVYRRIIVGLIPNRKPSCKLAESYFITTTTVVFHFFFYLLAPGTYYLVAKKIPNNIKLKLLFSSVVVFLIMVVIVCFIDLRYRLYNGRKKKLLNQPAFYEKLNQGRLHDQLNPPSFPIQFKIMVILNIWSFNAFYVFQIPYIMFLSAIVLLITYWNDKRILYNHYKLQSYLSISLQMKVQKFYTVFFLIFTSLSFASTSIYSWEYYFVGGIFLIAMVINFALNFTFKKRKQEVQKSMTIKDMIKTTTMNPKNSMILNLKQNQLKATFLIPSYNQDQTQSLGSLIFISGYSEVYERYLNQFRNKRINEMMEIRYNFILQRAQKDILPLNPQNNQRNDIVLGQRDSEMKQFHNDSKLSLNRPEESERQKLSTKESPRKQNNNNRKLSLEDKDEDDQHLQNHSQGEKNSNSNSDQKQEPVKQDNEKTQNLGQQKKE